MSCPVPLTLVTTTYGRPGLIALREAISEHKHGDPLAPVTVIVPNNFVGLASRRALAGGALGSVTGSRHGIAGVDFLTTYRLAELLGALALAGAGSRPVSTPVVAAAVRRVLEAEPGYFERVAEHPTTERRLVAAHRELSDLAEDQLDQLSRSSARAKEVVRIHRGVKQLLRGDWHSEQDLVLAAIKSLHSAPERGSELGAVLVFLPQEMSALRARFLKVLIQLVPTTVLAGFCGAVDADATVTSTLTLLGLAPPTAEALSEHRPTLPKLVITSVSDADDEVRHVVRSIVDAARHGVPFDRMAVITASPQPYLRLLSDHLDSADIPSNGAAVTTVGESIAGRVLRRLLSLTDRDYRREEVMGLLASSPIRWHGTQIPTRAWDLISRDAGVVKGADDWQHRLTSFVAKAAEERARLGDDPEFEWRSRQLARSISLAERLRAFMTDLTGRLAQGAALNTWAKQAAWCQRSLRQYLGDQHEWPESERRSAERINQILDRLAGLDAIESAPTLSVFRRTLDLELEGGLGRVGSFGNGVLVGHASTIVGLDLDRIWIVGMSEGTFPSRPRDDSLLPDRERRQIDGLRVRFDRVGDEHRHFLAALAAVGPTGQANLFVPRGDLRQTNELVPSRWLIETAQELTNDSALRGSDFANIGAGWLDHVASFTSGVLRTPFPPTQLEYDLRDLADGLQAEGTLDNHRLLQNDSDLALGAEMQRSRQSTHFTRFDGNLSHVDVEDPTLSARAMSATALETWARCPHQYFVRNLLRVDPLETPELRIRIDPLSKGRLVHAVLEEFVNARILRGSEPVGWSEPDRLELNRIATEQFAGAEARGLTGEPLYWRRDQVLIRRDLDEFLRRDSERRIDSSLRPLATELGFGLGGDTPVDVRLNDGRTLELRGSIDLVDQSADGDLVIIDYKTGKETRLDEEDPHKGGTKLQLVLYAIAARAVLHLPDAAIHSSYWHIRARSQYCLTGYRVTPEIERAVLAVVGTIIDGIAGGIFPQHPEETNRSQWVSCPYCDPDALGVSDARRRFVRKAGAPEIADYIVLTEPGLLPPTVPS